MTPTREQVLEWARSIEGARVFEMGGSIFGKPEYLERFAALAFAAGAQSSAPSGSGAELVREIEAYCDRAAATRLEDATLGEQHARALVVASVWWHDIRAALIAGAQSSEDARDAALDLLETMYRLWENGIDCYLDPEDQTGYLGKAIDLDDPTERKIADLLNEHRPAKIDAAMKGGKDDA